MSNNTKILIVGLLILVVVGGLFAYRMATNTSSSSQVQPQEPVVRKEPESSPSLPKPVTNDKSDAYNRVVTVAAPEGSTKYVLAEGSEASYSVTKVFVGKPQATIVGVTKEIEGGGWYDPAGKKFYLKANIALNKLKSDSEKRDEDILPLFTPPTATIVINGDNANDAISMTEPFETQLNADLTVGEVTKPVVLDVKGMLDASKFTAEGTTQVKMSDFGITPPSMLNIYSVEDATTLMFNVTANAIEEAQNQ